MHFYRNLLRVGGGAEQPGADLLAAWYRRNFHICANLVQLAQPGDRVVVFYGSGHAFPAPPMRAARCRVAVFDRGMNDYLPK